MKKFFSNKPRAWFTIGAIFVSILLVAGISAVFLLEDTDNKSDVYATIGDKEILNSDVITTKEKCISFYEAMDDEDTVESCQQISEDKLVMLAALEYEATNNGVTISEEDVNTIYQNRMEGYDTEEEYLTMLKNFYGWEKEDVVTNIKIDLYQEKLASLLISSKSVIGAYARWDFEGGSDEMRKNNSPLAKIIVEKYFEETTKIATKESDYKEIIQEAMEEPGPWESENIVGTFYFNSLNDSNYMEWFAEDSDWQKIKNLENNGDMTDIFTSDNGYVAVYRLLNKSNGSYNSWDEFLESYKKSSVTQKNTFINNLFGNKAEAAVSCPFNCSATHFSQLVGRARNGETGQNIYVRVEADYGTIGTRGCCNGEKSSVDIYSYKSTDYDSNGNSRLGYFVLGKRNDLSYKALSCFIRWNIEVKKSHYTSLKWINRSTGANGTSKYIDYARNVGRSGESITGDYYSAENNDNDGIIYLKPDARYTLSYDANGGTGAPNSKTIWKGEKVTVSSAKPSKTNYDFVNWNTRKDGKGTSYSGGNQIALSSNLTLYAQWKLRIVKGCTDSTADNYNPNANEDDGTCKYTPTCSALPLSGFAPLSVKFTITGGAGKPYELFYSSTESPIKGTFDSKGKASHWYTYNEPGTYDPYLRSTSKNDECGNPNVIVNSPTESDGGEVAP